MRILAIEGALGPFSCCVRDRTRTFVETAGPNQALEAGLGLVDAALRHAGIDLGAIDRIAVGTGPGSFTGLRVAVSYAKSLALARGLPLVGVSSYDALEPEGADLPVVTAVRGRAGVVCARRRDPRGISVRCGPTAEVWGELVLPGEAVGLVGATEDVLSAVGERGLSVRILRPRSPVPAEAVADLAGSREPASSPHAVRPDYGELPAARVPHFG